MIEPIADRVERADLEGTPDSAAASQPRWLRGLAVVGFASLGLLAIANAVRVVVIAYAALPWADMWNELPFVRRTLDGHAHLASWLAQHNEHRIVLSRVQFVVDFGLFGGRGIFLLVMIFLSSVILAVILAWPIVHVWNDPIIKVGFVSFAIAAVLTPAGWENLTWSFQVGFVQVELFAVAAIAAITLATVQQPVGGRDRLVLALTLASATAATWSNANGLIVWPILVLLAAVRRLATRTILALAVVGTAAHFPGAAWNLGTFGVAFLPGLALATVISGLGAKRA